MTILIQFSLQIKTPQIKQEKKTKGDKKKVQAAGMYINCLFKILLVIHNSN